MRDIYRALVEEQLSCRQITKRLNASKTPTPTGKNTVWQPATVRNILTNRIYAGQARYNYRQPVIPQYRKTAGTPTAVPQDRAQLSRGERMGLERSAGHYQRRAV